MVVESFKRQKISEVQGLFDRANTHPLVGYFGPFRYIPAKFWATSESEVQRMARELLRLNLVIRTLGDRKLPHCFDML